MSVEVNLMQILDDLASEHDVPLVDGMAHTNENPEHLVSWVHLSEEGNASLARSIQSTLEKSGNQARREGT